MVKASSFFNEIETLIMIIPGVISVAALIVFIVASVLSGKWFVYGKEYLSHEDDVPYRSNALAAVILSICLAIFNLLWTIFVITQVASEKASPIFLLWSLPLILAVITSLISRKKIKKPLPRDKQVFSILWLWAVLSIPLLIFVVIPFILIVWIMASSF